MAITEKLPSELTIASYNVHGCVGTDGQYDPDRVVQVISEMNADVVGLQEVDSRRHGGGADGQLRFLAERTGLHPVAGPTIRSATGDYGNAVLSRRPPSLAERISLVVPGREPRGLLDVEYATEAGALRVVTTHLGLSRRERGFQIERLLMHLKSHQSRGTVLLGDFNEWWPFGRGLRELSSWFGRTGHLRTFPSRLPLLGLDRIWVLPPEALGRIGVHRSPVARRASDHLPITARIKLG